MMLGWFFALSSGKESVYSEQGLISNGTDQDRFPAFMSPCIQMVDYYITKNSRFYMETGRLGAESNSIGESYVSGSYINLFFCFLTEGYFGTGWWNTRHPDLVTKIKRSKTR